MKIWTTNTVAATIVEAYREWFLPGGNGDFFDLEYSEEEIALQRQTYRRLKDLGPEPSLEDVKAVLRDVHHDWGDVDFRPLCSCCADRHGAVVEIGDDIWMCSTCLHKALALLEQQHG